MSMERALETAADVAAKVLLLQQRCELTPLRRAHHSSHVAPPLRSRNHFYSQAQICIAHRPSVLIPLILATSLAGSGGCRLGFFGRGALGHGHCESGGRTPSS